MDVGMSKTSRSGAKPRMSIPIKTSRRSEKERLPLTGLAIVRGWLGAVRRVDADVFGGEVAGPVAGTRFAGVHIHDNGNVIGEQFVGRGAFVEIERLAFAQDFDAGHGDF